MKKLLIMLMVVCLGGLSLGATFTQSNLNDEQVALLEKQAAELKLKEFKTPTVQAREISEWVELGTQLGKGLSGCAKELGVAANDFVQTPVGIMTASVIVWHFIGEDLMHVAGSLLFFLIAVPTWIYFFRKTCVIKSVSLGDEKTWMGLRSKKVVYYGGGEVDGTRGLMAIAALFIMAITCLMAFTV